MDAFEEQMRKKAPSWSAFDIRMSFEGYLEHGFVAEDGDVEKLTKLLGQPRSTFQGRCLERELLRNREKLCQ